MKIAGIQKNSFVDFPGKVSAVLFTPGCNMNCFYCHNRRLLSLNKNEDVVEIDEVSQLLAKRKGFLDAVVISGGEPTLQTGLGRFLEKLKGIGYKVKLDTNGTNPQVIESLIGNNLVDYIAMDIKAPFERYSEVCCTDVDAESIRRSIKVLMEGRIDYEFRTTVAPGFDIEDIVSIAREIRGARKYVLQNYRSVNAGMELRKKLSPEMILSAAGKIKGIIERVETRGIVMYA